MSQSDRRQYPIRVMLAVRTPEARMAAVLHDVVEDTTVTLDELRAGGAASVLEAVEALTKPEGEDYGAFIRRVAPTERDRERIRKYRKAIAYLERWD